MHKFLTTSMVLILFLWGVILPLQAGVSDKPAAEPLPQPTVELKPEDVVRIVIKALANNDLPYPDAGIATTFNFASPANKVNTGPLEKFVRMVKAEPYGPMVDHVASEFSEVVYMGHQAYQMVHLTGADGRGIIYAFRLKSMAASLFGAPLTMTSHSSSSTCASQTVTNFSPSDRTAAPIRPL